MTQVEKTIQKAPQIKQTLEQKNAEREVKFQNNLQKAINNRLNKFSVNQKIQIIDYINKLRKIKKNTDVNSIFLKIETIYQAFAKPENLNLEKAMIEIKKFLKHIEFDHLNNNKKILRQTLENERKNKIVQDKKEIAQDKKEIAQDKKEIAQDKKEIHKNQNENDKKRNEINDAIKKLEKSLANLPDHLKIHSQEQLNQTLNSLSPENQKKLQKAGIQPQEYAQFLLTKEAIFASDQQTPETQDFLESLKNLETSLNLNTKNFPNSYQVNKEFLSENPDMLEYAKTAPELRGFEKKFNSETLQDRDQIKNREEKFAFVDKFGSDPLKNLQKEIKLFYHNTETQEQKDKIEQYKTAFNALVESFNLSTCNILKASSIQAPITLLNSCLDRSSLEEQNLSQLREKQANAVKIATEDKGQIAKISGTIQGNPISFFYNLSNPSASLETFDHFNFDPSRSEISIGDQARTKLNLQLPTVENISEILQKNLTPEDIQALLADAENPKDYMDKLMQRIHEICQEHFSPSDEIKSRVCLHTEKNLTSQVFSDAFFPPHLQDKLQNPALINNDPQLKKLLILFDFSSEHMDAGSLQTFRKTLKKLSNLIQNADQIQKITDPVLKNQLEKLHKAMQSNSSLGDWTQNMLDFFNLFVQIDANQNSALNLNTLDPQAGTINIADFENFLKAESYSRPLTSDDQLSIFSPTFKTKYTKNQEASSNKNTQQELTEIELAMNAAFEQVAFA